MEPRVVLETTERASENPPIFSDATLTQLESEFLKGLESLDQLAAKQTDPFELVRQEAPRLADMLRQMAGVEVNQAFSQQVDTTANRMMEDLHAVSEQLRREKAELERDPNRAITDALIQLSILSSTGHLAPEDYNAMVAILATQRDRIAREMILSYDDRLREVQSKALDWYRRYNLAKAQQNAPFVNFAVESLRSGARLTKMQMDQMADVFDRHYRLNRLRLDALTRGARTAHERQRLQQSLSSEWMRLAIQVGRFTSTLDDTEQSRAARRRFWAMFAQHTERLRDQARAMGLGEIVPELNDTDIATLSMAMNPSVYLNQLLAERAGADVINLHYQAARNRIEMERISNEIVIGGDYSRLLRSLEQEQVDLDSMPAPQDFRAALERAAALRRGYLNLGHIAVNQFERGLFDVTTSAPVQAPERLATRRTNLQGISVATSQSALESALAAARNAAFTALYAPWQYGMRALTQATTSSDEAIVMFGQGRSLADPLRRPLEAIGRARPDRTDWSTAMQLRNALLNQINNATQSQTGQAQASFRNTAEGALILHADAVAWEHSKTVRRAYQIANQKQVTSVDPEAEAARAYLDVMHEFLTRWGVIR